MRIGIVAIMAALAACLTLPAARAQPDCANWNSWSFFKTAGAEDVHACLRAGADPDAREGQYGFTPLHFAAHGDHAAAIKALFEAGADSDARDKDGDTPLHIAAQKGRAAAITALLEAGADPGARTGDGVTPFDVIPEDSPLIGTPTYWRLNDARWE